MLQQRAYDTDLEFDSIVANAGAIASVADNGSGLCRITTTGVHGMHATQISDGHKITVTGAAVETSLNTVHTVSAIITTTSFDTDIAFPGTDTATFVVEKIYTLSPGLLTSVLVEKVATDAQVLVAIQEIKKNDKHNANIVWVEVSAVADDGYFKGDSSLITGLKVIGNPTNTVKIVCSQMNRW